MTNVRLDANETAFFTRELESIKAKTYDIKYPELKARRLFPVSFEAGPGAESIVYQQFDQIGMAKLIASYADDLPRADVVGREFTARVKSIGASFGYNIQEIRAAVKAGRPLQARKASAAKRAVSYLENKVAFFGDSATGLVGFLSHPNVTKTNAPNGVSGTATWATKTPDEILKDMNDAANGIVTISKGMEIPDTMILPMAQYNYIKSTARSANSDKTILQYFLENNGYIKTVEWVSELLGAGASGKDCLVCYRKDPDALTLEIPQDFEQFPEEQRGLEYIVACHQRIGGVIVYYPLSVNILSGI
jgi:hypothetical protein